MALEEEVLNLQKDLVVYLLFSFEIGKGSSLDFYRSEFRSLIQGEGGLSPQGWKNIEQFFGHASLLLSNSIVYDGEKVREELVKGICMPEFTHAVMSAAKHFSPAEQDKALANLNSIVETCMEKSKNSEDLMKILQEKARRQEEAASS